MADMDMMRAAGLRLFPLLMLALAGCQSLAYYGQAARGQATLLLQRQPIPRLLADPATPPALRGQLQAVQRIRAFAAAELGLPVNGLYTSYVELGRPYAVWAVTASPELALEARNWCYWLVGCLSYRGYFREAAARREAVRLAREGWEVAVDGVLAYSTLGWFRDPVLSSFIALPEAELAELLFHELAHQVLYLPDDTAFNESLAVAVAEEGLRRYAARQGLDLAALAQARAREEALVALLLDWRRRLETALAGPAAAAEKRAAKAAVYAGLRAEYARLRAGRPGYEAADRWVASLNNARLNSVATYHALVPAFRAMLLEEDGNMARFLARCRALAALDRAGRHRRLAELAAAAAPAESPIPMSGR